MTNELNQRQIFLIQTFDKESSGLYNLIQLAAKKVGFSVFRVDSLDDADIFENVYKAVQLASIIIADITSANPNVIYEVGLAQSYKKPLILIANTGRSIPFDLAGTPVLIYDPLRQYEFIDRLAYVFQEFLEQPDSLMFNREKRQNVFLSYSHYDREFVDRLLIHLKPLEKEGLIDLWVDTRLRAGDKWKKEIEKALDRASVAILVVSADFLASDFITENELPPILRNAEEKGTRIIPLIAKPCRFSRDKNLKHFQSVNDPNQVLILLSEGDREKYYDQVAMEVEATLQKRPS